jgi:hypothetical protein
MRTDPKEHKIKLLIRQLRYLGVDIHHHNHQTIVSERKITVDTSGIVIN